MVKIIVAFATDEKCMQYVSALEEAGIPVFRRCMSANEVKRTMDVCGDAIVLTSCKLPDSTVDTLAWDLGKQALILATGRASQLEFCEHPEVFKLATPCSKGEMISAVNMLIQLYQMRLPRRTGEEKELIARAKEHLMKQFEMTEPQAHRYLQKGAMDMGVKLTDFASRILETDL